MEALGMIVIILLMLLAYMAIDDQMSLAPETLLVHNVKLNNTFSRRYFMKKFESPRKGYWHLTPADEADMIKGIKPDVPFKEAWVKMPPGKKEKAVIGFLNSKNLLRNIPDQIINIIGKLLRMEYFAGENVTPGEIAKGLDVILSMAKGNSIMEDLLEASTGTRYSWDNAIWKDHSPWNNWGEKGVIGGGSADTWLLPLTAFGRVWRISGSRENFIEIFLSAGREIKEYTFSMGPHFGEWYAEVCPKSKRQAKNQRYLRKFRRGSKRLSIYLDNLHTNQQIWLGKNWGKWSLPQLYILSNMQSSWEEKKAFLGRKITLEDLTSDNSIPRRGREWLEEFNYIPRDITIFNADPIIIKKANIGGKILAKLAARRGIKPEIVNGLAAAVIIFGKNRLQQINKLGNQVLHDLSELKNVERTNQTLVNRAWNWLKDNTEDVRFIIRVLKNSNEIEKEGLCDAPKKEIMAYIKSLRYDGISNYAVAAEAALWGLSQDEFEDIQITLKSAYHTPLEQYMKTYEGYMVEVLPANDARNLTFGHHTNCCQHIGGAADACTRAAVNSQRACTLAITKKKDPGRIIAGSFVWWDKEKVVFDNFEALSEEVTEKLMEKVIKDAAVAFSKILGVKKAFLGKGYSDINPSWGDGEDVSADSPAQGYNNDCKRTWRVL